MTESERDNLTNARREMKCIQPDFRFTTTTVLESIEALDKRLTAMEAAQAAAIASAAERDPPCPPISHADVGELHGRQSPKKARRQ